MTLTSTLESIGYRHESRSNGRHAIYNDKNELVGFMRACECWDYLRKEGLIEL